MAKVYESDGVKPQMSPRKDLTKTMREALFRAKDERRRRLANLPFEEKIAIVKKLNDLSSALNPSREANRAAAREEEAKD